MQIMIGIGIAGLVIVWLAGKLKSGVLRWVGRLGAVATAAGLIYLLNMQPSDAIAGELAAPGVITPLDEAGNPLPPVETITVQQGNLAVTVNATGKIAPAQQSILSFETPATVHEVLVTVGQFVRAGDVIARVDTTELDTALLNAQAAVTEAEANYQAVIAPPREIDVQIAQAEVAAAETGLYAASLSGPTTYDDQIAALQVQIAGNSLWQAQLNRDLAGGGPGMWIDGSGNGSVIAGINNAQSEVAIAQANQDATLNRDANAGVLASANGRLEQAQVTLNNLLQGPTAERRRRTEIDLENARLALQQAEDRLQQAELRAPYDGMIAQVNLVIGQAATRDRTVTIIDSTYYLLDLTVNESDIASIQTGQAVEVRLDAVREAVLSGQVTVVGTVPIPTGTTASQRVTYSVRVRLDSTGMVIRPGMSASGNIVLETLTDALIVPTRFLRTDPITLESLLTVPGAEPGTYQQIPVTVGTRNRDFTQITAGVEAGQEIVILPELPTAQDAGFGLGF